MIDNPCVRNCCLDQSDICLGCGRHVDEITGWHQSSDLEKQQILQKAAERLQQPAGQRLTRPLVNPPE